MRLSNAHCYLHVPSGGYLTSFRTTTATTTYYCFDGLWQGEAEASHADLVLVDRGGAVLLSVVGLAEEHAFITGSLLIFAHTAWLHTISSIHRPKRGRTPYLWATSGLALGLGWASQVGGGSCKPKAIKKNPTNPIHAIDSTYGFRLTQKTSLLSISIAQGKEFCRSEHVRGRKSGNVKT